MTQGRWIGLTIDSDEEVLGLVSAASRGVLVRLDPKDALELEACLIEGVRAVIRHAYRSEPGHRIRIYLAEEGCQVVIAILDNGRPTGPLTATRQPGDLVSDPSEDISLAMLRLVMDDVSYESRAGVNRLIMRRTIAPSAMLERKAG